MSNTLKQRFPRCTYLNGDGGRCARRVKPPDTICHIHRVIAKQGFANPLTEPVELDEMAALRKLARSSAEAIRLRAIDLLLSLRKEKDCAACAKRASGDEENTSVVKYATSDQKLALRSLLDQIAAIKRTIRIHIAAGGLPPASPEVTANVEYEHPHQGQPSREDAEAEPRDESESESAEHERQLAEGDAEGEIDDSPLEPGDLQLTEDGRLLDYEGKEILP